MNQTAGGIGRVLRRQALLLVLLLVGVLLLLLLLVAGRGLLLLWVVGGVLVVHKVALRRIARVVGLLGWCLLGAS